MDCPGKLYIPGPDLGVSKFELHLTNRLHRGKVEARLAEQRRRGAAGGGGG